MALSYIQAIEQEPQTAVTSA